MLNSKKDPIIPSFKYPDDINDRIRYAELFYQMKRKKQVIFIFKKLSILKKKSQNIDNVRMQIINMKKWKHIFEMVIKLGPTISKFKQYKEFQMWLHIIRRQKELRINFIHFLCVRKGIILKFYLNCWFRALHLKQLYYSIKVLHNENLKIKAFRAFVIMRLKKKRDIKNISSVKEIHKSIIIEKTFDLWKKKSKLKRLSNYYEKQRLLNILKEFFVAWIKNKRAHRRLLYLLEKLIEVKHQNFLYKSFKIWQSKFFDRRILCKKSDNLIRSIIKMRTRRLFRRWKSSINYIHDINEAITFVQNNSSSFTFKKCFFIWMNKYQKVIHLKELRKNQILSYLLLIQQAFFQKWQMKLKEIIQKRKKIQQLHSKIFDIKYKKAIFSLWNARYNNRKNARIKWLKAKNKWHSTLLSRFFTNWHLESKASKKYSHHLLQISFFSFYKYHQRVNRIKYVLLTTYKLYNTFLQKNMFERWNKIVILKKEMKNCQKQFRICVLLDSFILGSSNLIQNKKQFLSKDYVQQKMLDIKPIFTNDDDISQLTNELKIVQKQIAQNKDDDQLNKKYIQIVKRINQLQKY